MFFRVQVFKGPGPGPGSGIRVQDPGSGSRVRVQVLEVAVISSKIFFVSVEKG